MRAAREGEEKVNIIKYEERQDCINAGGQCVEKNYLCKNILYNSSCNKAGSVCCIKVQYQNTRFSSTKDGMKSPVPSTAGRKHDHKDLSKLTPNIRPTNKYGKKKKMIRGSKQNNRSDKETENEKKAEDAIVSGKRRCMLTQACQKLGGVCVQSGSCTGTRIKKCKGASCECCTQSKYSHY